MLQYGLFTGFNISVMSHIFTLHYPRYVLVVSVFLFSILLSHTTFAQTLPSNTVYDNLSLPAEFSIYGEPGYPWASPAVLFHATTTATVSVVSLVSDTYPFTETPMSLQLFVADLGETLPADATNTVASSEPFNGSMTHAQRVDIPVTSFSLVPGHWFAFLLKALSPGDASPPRMQIYGSFAADPNVTRFAQFQDDGIAYSVSQYGGLIGLNATATGTITAHTPVLFIPGLMGTEIENDTTKLWMDIPAMLGSIGIPFVHRGDTFMDPLAFNANGTPSDLAATTTGVITRKQGSLYDFNYTEGLTNEFVSRGYSTSTNATSGAFTLFPYDWRKDITSIADNELRVQIDTLLTQTGPSKIDIIAHSQGGLVIKKLLLDHPEYKNKIRKLIFVGTPQLGAPKAAKVLLYGDNFTINLLGLGLDPAEVKYISQNMPSAYELLPSPTYFTATSSYLGVDVLTGAPPAMLIGYNSTTQKLKDLGLNSPLLDNATTFHSNTLDTMDFTNSGIDVTNIVGCGRGTPGQIIKSSWGRSRINYVPGDGTVPVLSSNAVFGATLSLYDWSKDIEHAGMPSANGIRQTLADILTGTSTVNDPTISTIPITCGLTGHEFNVHSPVDLNIYDSFGNHVGPTADGNFEANIPGSSYDTLGEEKFAFVPEGQYTVKLNATGEGSFSFFSSKIENNETVSTASYLDVPIASTSKAEVITNDTNTQTIALDTTGNGTATTTVTPTAVLMGSSTNDITPPITTLTATGTQGVGGWYTSNVTITFFATDTATTSETASGVEKTSYSFDNGTTWNVYATSTPIIATTTTVIAYYSTDNMGNREAIASTTILIDATKPSTPVLTATPLATSTIELSWATSTDNVAVNGYQILRATSSTATTTLIATTTATTTTYTNTNLTASTTYWYQVQAVDLAGNVSSSSNKVSTTTLKAVALDTTPPTAPTSFAATVASSTQINLAWATSTDKVGVLGYKVERCTGASCTAFTQVATSTVTNYKNTSLTASTTYRFRVRAYDAAGNNSAYSSTTSATTLKTPTTIFQDTFESALNWTKAGVTTWYTGTPKVGTHAVRLQTTGSIEKAISLANYSNITITFKMGANSLDSASENVQALYYNGTAWVTLATIANNSANENNLLNPYTFTLPVSMNNKTTFKLRFKINGSAVDDYGFVDDVKVVGTPK